MTAVADPASTRRHTSSRRAIPKYLGTARKTVLGMRPGVWAGIVFVVLGALIEAATRFGLVDRATLLPMTEIVGRATGLLLSESFLTQTLVPTLQLILISFVLAVVLGVLIAYGLWRSSFFRRAVEPYLDLYYALPTFALYPILVLLIGAGPVSILILSVTFSLVVVATNTFVGFDSVPRAVLELSASLRLKHGAYLRKVLLPNAVPAMAVGARLALVYSIVMVLATQFILSTEGLGHFISFAYDNYDVADMYAGVFITCLIALVGSLVLTGVERRLNRHRRSA